MRVTRPLFSFLAIFFLFANIAFSQSSIYKDAKELAEYLENAKSFKISFEQADSTRWNQFRIKKDEKYIRAIAPKTYSLSEYGKYELEFWSWFPQDSLVIMSNDSILIKIGRVPIDTFKNSSDSTTLANIDPNYMVRLGEIINSPTEWYSRIFYDIENPNELDQSGNPKIQRTTFSNQGKKDGELSAAKKVLHILHSHSDFTKIDSDLDFSFHSTQFDYALNPYLNNLNIESPLLSPNIDAVFPGGFFYSTKNSFSKYYYQNNPWHKLLYGDSLLNFQKIVSFKDASSSYRKRIVTSQNELTDASIRINETNKRKNLLDAKTVAVGLSDFIAERAQEELNLTFFNRFKQNLENPSELTVLFPNTKNLLYQFEISNYKTLLSHARESFKVDLDNLGLNFPEVLKLDKYKSLYNSPEVFNLSLIYSIADLAYKEEPVENILIAAFQKLKERKQELNKSINVELADNFIAAVTPKAAKKSSITSKQIQNNTELQLLKKYVEEYLAAVTNSKTKLKEVKDSTINVMFSPTRDMLSPQNGQVELREFNQMNSNLTMKFRAIHRDFNRPIQYNNRRIEEYSLLNFYKKTIDANLNGKEYYGYLIQNPNPEDYQLYFKPAPDSINSILAEGIEGSRNMLAENFDAVILENYNLLKNASKVYRKVIKEHVLHLENLSGPEKKIIEFTHQVNLLKSAIDYEIVFWGNIAQQDSTDHHIAGLYFLKALLERDIQIKLFFDVADLVESGNNYNLLVENYYPNTLGKDYQKNMNLALNRLDSLQVDFEDKIKALTHDFGNLNLNDSIYQHQQIITQFHIDTLAFNQRLKSTVFEFDDLMKFLNNVASSKLVEPAEEILSYEDSAPEIAAVADKIYFHIIDMSSLSEQLNQLMEELGNTTDAAQKENLNSQINQLNEERDEHEMAIESILDENLEKLSDLKNAELAILYPEKDSLFLNFQEKLNGLKGSSTPKNLRDVYSLGDNPFLEIFEGQNKFTNEINLQGRKEMAGVNNLDEQLKAMKSDLDDLKIKRRQLENYFTKLDTTYCKSLVAANSNARNLAKSLEFSTHLLFAFRDYERIYDTVFVYDSSYIKVTVNQLDTLTKFTNTITSDSLVVRKKPIKGTTEPLIAARWITRKEFNDLRKNKLQWNLFLGLLYQRLRSIEDAPNFSAEGVALLATKFLSITHDMETYRSNLRKKKATTPDLVTFKDYYPSIRSTVDLFNTVITTPSLADTSTTVANKFGLGNIPQISNEALSLYENIYVKEYGNAILNAMELLKIISNKKLGKKEARKSQRSINAVLTYGSFMASMINAQTSDQVKNILKSATLPPGSSRIKRETVTSFTINSYLGAAVGRDRLLGIPENLDLKQDAFGASLAVPIGFTYSFSPNIIKNNSSFSIHVPLLDLGAITAYRQNPDNPNYSIDDLPDFSWQNLFSPGLFVVYNFADSPFSLGVGGQYGPQLRQITPTGGEAINVNSWRFPMAFFTIDVPFFNLHTGARKIVVD